MNNSIQNGILAGAVLIAIYCGIWAIKPKANFWLSVYFTYSTVVFLFFMIRTARQQRAEINGQYGFGDALLPAMGAYTIGSLIYTIFVFMTYYFVPSQLDLAMEANLEIMEYIASFSGTDEEELFDQMDMDMKEMQDSMLDIGINLSNWVVSILFPGLLYGVIAAAVSRKKQDGDSSSKVQ